MANHCIMQLNIILKRIERIIMLRSINNSSHQWNNKKLCFVCLLIISEIIQTGRVILEIDLSMRILFFRKLLLKNNPPKIFHYKWIFGKAFCVILRIFSTFLYLIKQRNPLMKL